MKRITIYPTDEKVSSIGVFASYVLLRTEDGDEIHLDFSTIERVVACIRKDLPLFLST